jgi:hypothetical protein
MQRRPYTMIVALLRLGINTGKSQLPNDRAAAVVDSAFADLMTYPATKAWIDPVVSAYC